MRGKTGKQSVTPGDEKQTSARDRAQHRCPDLLARLINLVNSIPPERELPHYAVLFNEGIGPQPAIKAAKEKMSDVPEWFLAETGDELTRYISFRSLRQTVHAMAQIASLPVNMRVAYAKAVVSGQEEWEKFQQGLRQYPAWAPETKLWREWDKVDAHTSPAIWGWPRITFDLAIDAEGRITPRELEMQTALFGVEAKRLRECQVCQRIFWARQDNMMACSPRCSTTRRQRLKRERDAQYEASRRKKKKQAGKAKKG